MTQEAHDDVSLVLREPWTVERFLRWEDRQEGRHEFDGERIIPMTGGSLTHQRIIRNLSRFFEDCLDPRTFEVVQEMRVDVGGRVRYPDFLVCAAGIAGSVRTLRDAIVTFEVLSDDTADTDRHEKPFDYARLQSLRRYVLLEQSTVEATVLERGDSGWIDGRVNSGVISLPEIGVVLPLDDVYRGVRF